MLAVDRAAYLTIDEGPAEEFMQKVDYLNARGVHAIWFCLGEALERFSDAAVHAIRSGHIIGNRSYDHVDFSSISWDDARGQVERTDQVINGLYVKAEAVRPAKVFRFPYSEDESRHEHFAGIQRMLGQLGYEQPSFDHIQYEEQDEASMKRGLHVSCTLDTFDLGAESHSQVEGRVGNEIIRIHDWIAFEPFKSLLDRLLTQGMTFTVPKEWSQTSTVV
ncbi:peptidoglycan/xylan/chitin deacetylase (PgdA/CDA1 family) [Paenibacillus endophyticus]|uniref:Peptidoglycan/xylan/chitin deacetylase (PgdA/CDA1 family) n=1 Tax=Paenibacillus endophyticus TaxID=1294268 RepID=A0A7W5GCX5_9BACL|nr:polysaccharide deacetylase family protein [Paenibacillus endophyticus]MBB3155320.1 peptidoglycan/xylan/chitin deacetylase (PgdA/CDA1 family) [Paenibacillus endophyticus]